VMGLLFVILWENVNNQKYVGIILLKMTFGFPKVKWLDVTGEVDKSVRFSCHIFSGFNTPKIIKKLVNFWQSYFKIKRWMIFGTLCSYSTLTVYTYMFIHYMHILITSTLAQKDLNLGCRYMYNKPDTLSVIVNSYFILRNSFRKYSQW